MLFCRLFKINFFEKFFWEYHQCQKSLDPDQARHFVGPDLGPNCLQKFSAGDTRRQRVKQEIKKKKFWAYTFVFGQHVCF